MKRPDLGTHDNPVVDERRSCKEARDAKEDDVGWSRSSGRVDAPTAYAPAPAVDISTVSTTAGAPTVVDASVAFADAAGFERGGCDESAGTTTRSSEPGIILVVLVADLAAATAAVVVGKETAARRSSAVCIVRRSTYLTSIPGCARITCFRQFPLNPEA